MIISPSQSVNVVFTELADVLERLTTSPGKGFTSEQPNGQVGHETSMASVPVRERVDEYKSVVKPYRDLVARIDGGLGPEADVIQEPAEPYVDLRRVYADVLPCVSPRSGPGPHVPEHSLVEIENEFHGQDLAIAELGGPGHGFVDIDLFGLVEVCPCRDPGLPEPLLLLGSERGRVIVLCKQVIHWESQRFRSVIALAM